MDSPYAVQGSGSISLGSHASWSHEGVPWDDSMKEIQVEIPEFLSRLLQHNNPPTQEDVRLCKEYQDSLEEPLLSVQSRRLSIIFQIEALQEELRALEKEKTSYSKQSFACDVACAPIRRLPLEIVQEIATHLLIPRHVLLSGKDPLISMSQVSSGWRKALASMPRLWARFGIETMKTARSGYLEALERAILEYSQRSRPFPLDIQLSLADVDVRSTRYERSHQLLSWLISDWTYIDRVQRLHINSFRFFDVLTNEIRDAGNFSTLKRLVLASNRSTRPFVARLYDENTDWGNLFANAPKLQRLSFDSKLGLYFQNMCFPFQQITHLFLGSSLSFGPWTTLLGKLCVLKHGFFSLRTQGHLENLLSDHPFLEHLAVNAEDFEAYSHCTRLIGNGCFPNLSHVEFMIQSSNTWYMEDSTSSRIQGVPSKHLSLWFAEEPAVEVILAILRSSPNVETLELGLSASKWGRLFDGLMFLENDVGNQILPNLNTLVVQASVPTDTLSWKGTYFESSLCKEFINMVHSRCTLPTESPSALRAVYLLLVQHPDYNLLVEHAEAALSTYRRAGLSLQMRNLSESLEDSRQNNYLEGDWDMLLPALPQSHIPRRHEGPWI